MAHNAENRRPLTPVALQILLSLARTELHGYGIKLDIEERTAGKMSLGSGTLYEAIQRLERDSLIEPVAGENVEGGRRRQCYRITDAGQALLQSALSDLENILSFARENHLYSGGRLA